MLMPTTSNEFPTAEKVVVKHEPTYQLTHKGTLLGLFRRLTPAEASERPDAVRAKLGTGEKARTTYFECIAEPHEIGGVK